MSFRILSDSSSNLTEEIIEEYNIAILPLTFMIDGVEHQSYLEGAHTDLSKFYKMMRDGKLITTSLPNLAKSERKMRSILDNGEDLLYIGFSSGLSGTYESIALLAKSLQTEYPNRKILTVDTLAASGGEGLLVWYAANLAREGKTIDEVYEWLEEHKLHLAHWFTVDDLMFLFRGGRVSKTSAWAGTLLNIKPIMHVNDEGHLIPLDKVRGRKKSLDALIQHMSQTANEPISDQMIFINHGDCLDDALYLKKSIEERFDVKNFVINYVDPVIGAHSGPGTMALFFMASER